MKRVSVFLPTDMLKTKPLGSPRPYSLDMILQAHHAFTYSSNAWGTVSSVDHSQL